MQLASDVQKAHTNRDNTNADGLSSESAKTDSRPEPDEDPQQASHIDRNPPTSTDINDLIDSYAGVEEGDLYQAKDAEFRSAPRID
ncbi:hypothetical protein GJ744_010960 [Endocarpon pusillum]|uniref:Uncharacterized protein n=1 Tax=Endocarpon pusillum TaxID=364733 RepID=A0A8H7AFP9_9EURO|nr:hypothetical protein GJ744_010960 [Endocarpon pusillum]